MAKNVTLVGDWKTAEKILNAAPAALTHAAKVSLLQEGEYLRGRIVKKIRSNVPPPNSKSTIAQKRSSKTLINHGDLANAPAVLEVGPLEIMIGIPRSTKGQLAKLADVLENGRTIVQRITPKQRKFLHALYAKLGPKAPGSGASTGVLVIHIPARPFIRPVFDEEKDKIPERFITRLARNLDKLGAPMGSP